MPNADVLTKHKIIELEMEMLSRSQKSYNTTSSHSNIFEKFEVLPLTAFEFRCHQGVVRHSGTIRLMSDV